MARWRRARACRPTSSRRPGARTSVLSRTPFRTRPSPRPSTICGPPSRQRRQPHSGRQCCRAGMLGSEREEVAAACRRLAAEGLVLGTAGNVSARAGSHVAISATGAVLADATPDQVTVVNLEGEVVDGQLAPTSELDLHLGVYRRYDAGAVVHTHAPTATALSCVLDDELPCVHYSMLLLGGAVKVAPYATFGTPELAESVLDALEGRAAALMANHGAIAHAHDLAPAVEHSLPLEWACGVYWRAATRDGRRAGGRPATWWVPTPRTRRARRRGRRARPAPTFTSAVRGSWGGRRRRGSSTTRARTASRPQPTCSRRAIPDCSSGS